MAGDHFHVGIVVDDYKSALAELADAFGYEWCHDVEVTIPVSLPGGDQDLHMHFTFSVQEPRLEIVEAIPGTPWVPAEGSGIHHLGYWSDDVERDSAALEQRGHLLEAKAVPGPDGSPTFAYHRSPSGPRIELVDRSARTGMEQLWAIPR